MKIILALASALALCSCCATGSSCCATGGSCCATGTCKTCGKPAAQCVCKKH